jgi:TfoX/Sxy family transcriptional regulator of competence genes
MNYFEVPAEVLEDAGELVSWARRSAAVARQATAAAKRRRGAKRGRKAASSQARKHAKSRNA